MGACMEGEDIMEVYWLEQAEYMLRISAAALCGAMIGIERKSRMKSAGIRTHIVVAIAAALMMILSKYGFDDVLAREAVDLDPSRIAAGIVTAIGFLGTGVIFVHRKTVRGLTTAAGIWATVGIGMTVGAGMYVLGIATTLLLIALQFLLHKRIGSFKAAQEIHKITALITDGAMQMFLEELKKRKIEIVRTRLEREGENEIKVIFAVRYPKGFTSEDALKLVAEIPGILSAEL